MEYYLAVDIGASSGRHMLGWVEDGVMKLEEVYRFENGYAQRGGKQCWDLVRLHREILAGMKRCRELGKVPATMGIDTWAVDYVLLDENDVMLGDTVAYRDDRTVGMDTLVEQTITFESLYGRTGIQKQPFNTLYQLMAQKQEAPEQLVAAKSFLMVPEYLNYRLTGEKVNEYTNATTTAMVDADTCKWDLDLLKKLGLPTAPFGELAMPGTVVGPLLPEVEAAVGFGCTVVLPATHDTGSAYLAVPAKDEDAVYLSSGTWSLLGIESHVPIITEEGLAANFTNEGGYDRRYRFLKNIMGLWMIQSIRRELDKKYSFAELEAMARECSGFEGVVDANDSLFLAPKSMIEAVKAACEENCGVRPESIGEVVQCVYQSLALCYAEAIEQMEEITGHHFTSINIVGGGSKDGYLNELTAKRTGLPVYAGPTEGTVIGNLMAQMLRKGVFADIAAARACVARSFDIKENLPA